MRIHFAFIAVAVLAASTVVADDNLDDSKAIQKIELLGGKITRDEALPGSPVVEIDLRDSSRFGDKYVHLLKSFKELHTLHLTKIQISDDGQTHSLFTDEGMKGLRSLTNLTTLGLASTGITDAGLPEIKDLKKLTTLNLLGTRITDASFEVVKELSNLTELDLTGLRITNNGLKELHGLTNLRRLVLTGTKITDDGLKEIGKLKNLTTLDLSLTQITDVGLEELNDLENLEALLVFKASITDAGVEKLKTRRPNLKIERRKTAI